MLKQRVHSGLELSFMMICVVNKLLALVMIKNLFGLPDYVLGELLSSSLSSGYSDGVIIDGGTRNLNNDDSNEHNKLIRFSPRQLSFAEHSIGVPFTEKVYIENVHDETIHMISISGTSVHFHCSFFDSKVIQPQSNTSFDVVFLAREEGHVSNTLYIHTSVGSFNYQVTAIGVVSEYRLRPLVGAKVPLNSSYAETIHIYNPHNYSLQLTEMYSTGGGLHLELPNGAEGLAETWRIAPYETKAVMRAHFLATSEKKHAAYIRIKTNATGDSTNGLILPVEVEVSSAPGIYSPIDQLHFGILRTSDPAQEMSLRIINAGLKPVTVQNIVAFPTNDAIEIVMTNPNPPNILPDVYHPTEVAKIVLDPSKIANCGEQCSGKIMVKSKNQKKLYVPYQVQLLSGYLAYNQTRTQFYVNHQLTASSNRVQEKRTFEMVNRFNFSILVHGLFVPEEAKPYFEVAMTKMPIVFAANESKSIAMITFSASNQLSQLETYFRLHTNISHFDIKLHAYTGRLRLYIPQSPQNDVLNFGAFALNEKQTIDFALVNDNPIDIVIKNLMLNMTQINTELIAVDEGNLTTAFPFKGEVQKLSYKDLTLKPNQFAIFRSYLDESRDEKFIYAEMKIDTHKESIVIPVEGRAIKGTLSGSPVLIGNAFPARISAQTVLVSSSFSAPLSLKSHFISPLDENRFVFEPTAHDVVTGDENRIGKLYFDPMKNCDPTRNCYAGLSPQSEVGHLWTLGLSLHPDTGYIDKELHQLYYNRWLNIASQKTVNATLNLEMDSQHRVQIEASASLEWPRIVCGNKNYVKFPVTRFGDTQVKEVLIENPSSQPLLVQAVLLSDYPDNEAAISLLDSYGWWKDTDLRSSDSKGSFKLIDMSDESFGNLRLSSAFHVSPSSNSVTMLMPVGQRTRISVVFRPSLVSGSNLPKNSEATIQSSTVLLLRNNLTILDAVHISGEAGSGMLKIGSQLPGLKSLLNFDIQEKHLSKSCLKGSKGPKESSIEPQFTVQKSFNLINYGKVPIIIRRFVIGPHAAMTSISATRKSTLASIYEKPQGANKVVNDLIGKSHCQGFGFKILDCETMIDQDGGHASDKGLIIKPNESKKIYIAFTPDFTVSKTMATLTIVTDEEDVDHSLKRLMSVFEILTDFWNFISYRITAASAIKANRPIRRPITYSLIATVPKHLLQPCSNALPRPYHEMMFYYSICIVMVCIVLIAVVLSFLGGAHVLQSTFYPSIILSRTPVNYPEHFEAFSFHNINNEIKDSSKCEESTVKQRRNGKGKDKPIHSTATNKIYESATSWTSYLAKKFQRKDSSGSIASSGSGNSKLAAGVTRTNSAKGKSKTPKIKDILLDSPLTNGAVKKTKSKSWFSLSKSVEPKVEEEEAKPLPVFDAFDEDECRALNGKPKRNQPSKADLNVTMSKNSSPARGGDSSPEVEEPEKNLNNAILKCPPPGITRKPVKPIELERNLFDGEIGYWNELDNPNNGPEINNLKKVKEIWDSPITMFDSQSAMNELVKQSEIVIKTSKLTNVQSGSRNRSKSGLCSFVADDSMVRSKQRTGSPFEKPMTSHSSPRVSPSWSSNSQKPMATQNQLPAQPNIASLFATKLEMASNSWINEMSLDKELASLREDSTEWTSNAGRAPVVNTGLQQSSRLKTWTNLTNVDAAASRLWESIGSREPSTAANWSVERSSSSSSQSPPPVQAGSNVWPSPSRSPALQATPEFSEPWIGDVIATQSASDAKPVTSGASSFSLFGKSLWSPLSPMSSPAQSSWTFGPNAEVRDRADSASGIQWTNNE
ncbi:Transmembrane protein [Halotydeus destructor]|nr:Transmembrane protein [Halotydeus destructor]